MVIAPGQRHRRTQKAPRRRVRLLRSWRNGQSTVTTVKARTARLRWRHRAGARSLPPGLAYLTDSICCLPAGGTFPDSRAVRALSVVTVLCPFLPGRNDQPDATL